MRPALPLSLFAAALAFGGPAAANDGAFYGQGSTVFPVQDDAIALDTEILRIEQGGPAVGYYVDHWRVDVTYRFRNTTDKPVTVQMGFPEWCEATPDNSEEETCTGWTIRDFAVKIDGKKGPEVKIKKAEPGKGPLADMHYGRVHTFPVSFAAGQTRTVHHTYRHATAITSPWCSELGYILRTGALWKGAMKSLDISVRTHATFPGDMGYGKAWIDGTEGWPKATVEAHADGGQTLSWSLRDVEPKHDLALVFCEPKAMLARYEAANDVVAMTPDALSKLDAARLRVLRNTLYAAYGYTFKSADLNAHFAQQGWYVPRADFDPAWLPADAVKRIALIKALEKKKKAGE